jgi:molecular chaperone GrpE
MKNEQDFEENIEEVIEDETLEHTSVDQTEIEEDNDPFLVLEKLKTENEKLKEDVLRAYADAENTKRRALQEIDKNNKYAISSFAKNLLSVADNLDRAIQSASDNKECEALLKGVEMTKSELTKIFEKFGIVKMDILDKPFDPNYHQVVQEIESQDKPAGTIIQELQSGYLINDRILREAMVVVTKS